MGRGARVSKSKKSRKTAPPAPSLPYVPATVISPLAERHGYSRSLFQRMQENGHPSHLLDIQYRMHPQISLWPNNQFYEGALQNGANVQSYADKPWHNAVPR